MTISQSEFIDHLGTLKIPVVRYVKEELQRELAASGVQEDFF